MKLKNKILLWSLFSAITGCINDGSGSNSTSGVTITITSEIVDGEESFNSYTYNYNDDKKLTYISFDRDLDGQTDREVIYEYHIDGQRKSKSTYVTENGSRELSVLTIYEYSDENTYRTQSRDDDLDGVFDQIEIAVYDSNHMLIEVRYDHDADGVVDLVDDWDMPPRNDVDAVYYNDVARSDTNFYNDRGDLLGYSSDYDNDGIADYTLNIKYYADGLKESESWDYGADGTYEVVKIFYYSNNQINKTIETSSSGIVETQKFNESGYIKSLVGEDDDKVERKYSYAYSGDLSLLEFLHIRTYLTWN
jgi:hypothetical protein